MSTSEYAADRGLATAPREKVAARPEVAVHGGLQEKPRGWLEWLTTTDHKKIGLLYLFATFVFFILGGVEALMMRSQLIVPDNTLVEPRTYNALVTMHGTTMVFLFIVPVLAGFANYFVPLMIGARDMAFPRLNALSFWLLLFGGIAFYVSVFFDPPATGWTFYAPLSDDAFSPGSGVDSWIILVHLTGLSSIVGAINFVATIHNMRARGMGWGRMPLFIWSVLIYSYLIILALPAIAAAVTMLLTDRHFGTGFFDPTSGGDPMLWQHLFWFFGHPEVYIMVLPAFGIISEVLPVFARKPIFGYKAIAASTAGIAFLSMLVWAHHMFTTPIVDRRARVLHVVVVRDRGADRHQDLQLARDALARHADDEDAAVLRVRLPRDVRGRRHLGRDPRDLPRRLAAARHVLRRRAHALRAVRRGGVRHLRRALLLVPEDVRPDDERGHGQGVVLADVHRVQRHVPDPALGRPVGHAAARLRLPRGRRLVGLQPGLLARLATSSASGCC